jgi:hypothetical protein
LSVRGVSLLLSTSAASCLRLALQLQRYLLLTFASVVMQFLLQGANAAEALWLVLVLTALLAAARAAFVVPFSLLHNIWSADKLSSRDIVVVWWAGAQQLFSFGAAWHSCDRLSKIFSGNCSRHPLNTLVACGAHLRYSASSSKGDIAEETNSCFS